MSRLPTAKKVTNLVSIVVRCMLWKLAGKKVVFTNGCFDLLHVGHVSILERAKQQGDRLIVAVNSDRAVKILKGNSRPINSEQDRLRLVAALEAVDVVILVNDTRMADAIRLIRPSTWVKGGDYTLETLDPGEVAAARHVGAKITLLPSIPGVSTTQIVKAVADA